MALDERDFFNNRNETRIDTLTCPRCKRANDYQMRWVVRTRNETRIDTLTCPRCKRANDYQMRWVVRTRKDRVPPGADARDRALFEKLRDYMIRIDDSVTCKTCGKKFDIPSQHSMVFLEKGGKAPVAAGGAQDGSDDDSRFNR